MHLHEYLKATEIFFIFSLSLGIVSAVLAPYLKSLGLSNIELSLLYSVFPLFIIIFSPIIGKISDEIGRNKILILSIIFEIIAIAIYFFSSNIQLIIIARIFDGLALVSMTIAAMAKIENSVDDKTRGKFYWKKLKHPIHWKNAWTGNWRADS